MLNAKSLLALHLVRFFLGSPIANKKKVCLIGFPFQGFQKAEILMEIGPGIERDEASGDDQKSGDKQILRGH